MVLIVTYFLTHIQRIKIAYDCWLKIRRFFFHFSITLIIVGLEIGNRLYAYAIRFRFSLYVPSLFVSLSLSLPLSFEEYIKSMFFSWISNIIEKILYLVIFIELAFDGAS